MRKDQMRVFNFAAIPLKMYRLLTVGSTKQCAEDCTQMVYVAFPRMDDYTGMP